MKKKTAFAKTTSSQVSSAKASADHVKIGIDASRAFLDERTGIEEYSYQLLKHLRGELKDKDQEVVVFVRKGNQKKVDFELPKNWRIKEIAMGRGWTQGAMSLQFVAEPLDIFLVPAHTVPLIHPKNTIVIVHGLEFEHNPESYPWISRKLHRFFIRKSCRWAKKVIAISEKTKKDLVELYQVPAEKIKVVHNGFTLENSRNGGDEMGKKGEKWEERGKGAEGDEKRGKKRGKEERGGKGKKIDRLGELSWNDLREAKDRKDFQEDDFFVSPVHGGQSKKKRQFLFFVGRLEERKNISGIIKTFEILKDKFKYPGKLYLAGKSGYGYKKIKQEIDSSAYSEDIVQLGFIRDDQKWEFLKKADLFLFPSFSEGFGLPILEAQSVGTPVLTANIGPMDEVAGSKEILVNPLKPEEIAKIADKILKNKKFREKLIQQGKENVKRFSWGKCAKEVARLVTSN